MSTEEVRYLADDTGNITDVVVPMALWKEIIAELETSHLLESEVMKKRLLEARSRSESITIQDVLSQLGLTSA
ncbi:MAG: prevent-host-death protein [Candidatus Kapaibacterium sp.]